MIAVTRKTESYSHSSRNFGSALGPTQANVLITSTCSECWSVYMGSSKNDWNCMWTLSRIWKANSQGINLHLEKKLHWIFTLVDAEQGNFVSLSRWRFYVEPGIAQSVEHLSQARARSSVSSPGRCMLTGMWKILALLTCWIPRSQQVLHQMWFSGNMWDYTSAKCE